MQCKLKQTVKWLLLYARAGQVAQSAGVGGGSGANVANAD